MKDSNCQRLHLVFTAKNPNEHLFKKEIEDCVQQHPGKISAEFLTTTGGKNPRINEEYLRDTLNKHDMSSNKKLITYICGPPPMIKDFNNYLISLGVPKESIKYELWW